MADSVRLLFFAGSMRQGSFNRSLARCASDTALSRGFGADLIELSDYPMPIYDGDLEANEGPPENARRLKQVFSQYQGIFIASPEYNASVTPLLKNTLDWISRVKERDGPPLDVFKTRVFAIGGASPGRFGGMRSLMTLRQILAIGLGALVLGEQIAVANAGSAFDEKGALAQEPMQSLLASLVDRLADAARRFQE
jgi:NAD(P)H-dependent FMN reductase